MNLEFHNQSVRTPWVNQDTPGKKQKMLKFEYSNIAELSAHTAHMWKKNKAYTMVLPNGSNASLTYEQVDGYSDDLAVYLKQALNFQKGDRVAVLLPNCLAYPVCVFGILKAGGVVVNTNPLYTSFEMEHQFKDSGAGVLICVDVCAHKVEQILNTTEIKKVLVVSVADFFKPIQKLVIHSVLKFVKRQIPAFRFKFEHFSKALLIGSKIKKRKNIEVKRYWENIGLEDLCALQYTGGTTGVSKGAMLTHKNILANVMQIHEMGKEQIELGKDTILTVLPLYHIFAFALNLVTFYQCGGHNILVPNPRPLSNLKKVFEDHDISWISGVNTLFNGLMNEPWFQKVLPKKLKASVSGGTALHHAVGERWLNMTHTKIVEGFGLTETSPVVTFNPISGKVKSGTVGIAVPDTEVAILDPNGKELPSNEVGEIAVKGPQVMVGYWKRPEETAKVFHNGWLLTGDMGFIDQEGYLTIVDRKKDMIIVSGFNVYPNEVEDCLSKHPGIQEAAVIGLPNEQTGESVKAFIVKKDPLLSEEQVIRHCREFLTSYKTPRIIEFRTELPKTPIGKILRKELRKPEYNKIH